MFITKETKKTTEFNSGFAAAYSAYSSMWNNSSKQKEEGCERGSHEINGSSYKLISETISTVVNYLNCYDVHPDAAVLHIKILQFTL